MSYKDKTKKEYMVEYRKRIKYDKNAWFTKVYGRMKRDNKNKFNIYSLPFTKQEFKDWIELNYLQYFDTMFQTGLKVPLTKV